jgi:hypothetical protein
MLQKVRHYRIQLIAYDIIDVAPWSLPVIGPTPTPPALFPHKRKQVLHKVRLLPLVSPPNTTISHLYETKEWGYSLLHP